MFRSLLVLFLTLAVTSGFTPLALKSARSTMALSMAVTPPVAPPPALVVNQQVTTATTAITSSSVPMQNGIENYLSSSTQTLSLQERRPPTPEEIQAKKNTFNAIFWGGGFVAPFLATIFYFGFKFWEK